MKEELDILRVVADNPFISQRKISEQTNISLGQVNFLLKKCAKKGFIKIEGQTPRSIKYNITPKGMAEKVEKTYEYIKISYAAIIKLTDSMREFEKKYVDQGKELYVVGEEDELMEIARLALKSEAFKHKSGPNVVTINTREFI